MGMMFLSESDLDRDRRRYSIRRLCSTSFVDDSSEYESLSRSMICFKSGDLDREFSSDVDIILDDRSLSTDCLLFESKDESLIKLLRSGSSPSYSSDDSQK